MTEAEWLACSDPLRMLAFLSEAGKSVRKARLFLVACCARIEHLLSEKGKRAVAAGERFADGLISEREMHAAWAAVGFPKAPPRGYAAGAARMASCSPGYDGTDHGAASAANAAACEATGRAEGDNASERAAQVAILRDIFGNPFRPPSSSPRSEPWDNNTVRRLAEAIYAERRFDELPILADALVDVGRDDEELIRHCRGEGPHVRGCWAVDLLLGKE